MKHVRTHYKEQNRRKNSHMQCYRAGARRSRSTGAALAPLLESITKLDNY